MAWITAQSISIEDPNRPGFYVGESDSSPTLTLVFEDLTTAEDCANAMKRILDKAVGIKTYMF